MALLEGRTGNLIAALTMYSSGRIVEGICDEGTDHHGIAVRRIVLKHHTMNKSEARVSFFHEAPVPVWWNSTHDTALKQWMAHNELRLRMASRASTLGNRFDVSDKRAKGSVPEVIS